MTDILDPRIDGLVDRLGMIGMDRDIGAPILGGIDCSLDLVERVLRAEKRIRRGRIPTARGNLDLGRAVAQVFACRG